MRFTSTLASITTLVFFSSDLVAALPAKRSVWSPKIISPSAHTVWHHGETRNVTWETSDAPKQISNGFSVQLGYNHMISPLFLAKDFEPRHGWVEVTVPWVEDGQYTIILFGDSGNVSPTFTILESKAS